MSKQVRTCSQARRSTAIKTIKLKAMWSTLAGHFFQCREKFPDGSNLREEDLPGWLTVGGDTVHRPGKAQRQQECEAVHTRSYGEGMHAD